MKLLFQFFGGVKFKKVILDHRNDTLIYSNRISILEGKKMLDGDLIFDDLNLHGYFLILKPIKMKRNQS
jgi:hypothetical protein